MHEMPNYGEGPSSRSDVQQTLAELLTRLEAVAARLEALVVAPPVAPAGDSKQLLTHNEAAELLGVSRNTLYAWRAKGLIRFVKVQPRKKSSTVRYRRGELERFMMRNERAAR